MKMQLERRIGLLEDAVRFQPEPMTKFEMSILILNLLTKAHECKADPEEYELAREVANIMGEIERERAAREARDLEDLPDFESGETRH